MSPRERERESPRPPPRPPPATARPLRRHATTLIASLREAEALGATLDTVALSATFGTDSLSKQLRQVAKVVGARSALQAERDAFHVRLGGFDTHSDASETLAAKMTELDGALGSFVAEMKAQGAWGSTAILIASEFGRTITTNGQGTDHGWGGNALLIGGSVKGGRILGAFPDDLEATGDVVINRGRIIPTTSWESVWHGIAQWAGVQQAEMATVLPNMANFAGSLLAEGEMFE